jgi:hypothetical protein
MMKRAAADTPQVLPARHLRRLKLPTSQLEYDKGRQGGRERRARSSALPAAPGRARIDRP